MDNADNLKKEDNGFSAPSAAEPQARKLSNDSADSETRVKIRVLRPRRAAANPACSEEGDIGICEAAGKGTARKNPDKMRRIRIFAASPRFIIPILVMLLSFNLYFSIQEINDFIIEQAQLQKRNAVWEDYQAAMNKINASYRETLEEVQAAYEAKMDKINKMYLEVVKEASSNHEEALAEAETKIKKNKVLKDYEETLASLAEEFNLMVKETEKEFQIAKDDAANKQKEAADRAKAIYLGIVFSAGANLAASIGKISEPLETPKEIPSPTPSKTPSPTVTPSKSPTPSPKPSPTPTPAPILIPTPASTPVPTPTPSPTVTPPPDAALWDGNPYSDAIRLETDEEKTFVVKINSDKILLSIDFTGLTETTNAEFSWIFPDGRIYPGTSQYTFVNRISQSSPVKMQLKPKAYEALGYTSNIPDQYIPRGDHLLKIKSWDSSLLQFRILLY